MDNIEGTRLRCDGYDVTLCLTQYFNGRTAVIAECDDGTEYAKLTVNIPEYRPEPGEIIVKTWSENEPLAKAALASGLFEDTGKRVPTGFVEAQVWRVKA